MTDNPIVNVLLWIVTDQLHFAFFAWIMGLATGILIGFTFRNFGDFK